MLLQRECCPACGATNSKTIFSASYNESPVRDYVIAYYALDRRGLVGQYERLVGNGKYELNSCGNCGLIYQKSYPDSEFNQILYSEWISSRASANGSTTSVDFKDAKHYISEALKLVAMTMRLTGKSKPGELRVLDFGMGMGDFAVALKACGCETYGYDFAENRQKLGDALGLTVIGPGEIEGLDFDFINTEQVFEHLPDPGPTAQMLAKALRPNGLLKISVPFNRWLEKGDFTIDWKAGRYSRHSPMPNAPLEHLQYYRRPSLTHLGKQLGLKCVNISAMEHFQFSIEWLNGINFMKNIGRIVAFERFRNYYIFQNDNTKSV